MPSLAAGLAAALVSIVSFGSFALPLKSARVQAAGVDSMVWQCYMSLSIFLTSWALVPWRSFVWTAYGLASAALWVPASILSIFAIRLVGLATAQAVWSATTIVVSFLWGVAYFHDPVRSPALAALALAVILAGILVVARASRDGAAAAAASASPADAEDPREGSPLLRASGAPAASVLPSSSSSSAAAAAEDPASRAGGRGRRAAGLACAVLLGVTNGSMLVPMELAPDNAKGLDFVPSLGVGIAATTPVAALVYFWCRQRGWLGDDGAAGAGAASFLPPAHAAETLLPGMLSGVVWQLGNVGSIVAVASPLGLSVGFPLTQCALLVAGAWGIFKFNEPVRGRAYAAGALTMLAGAALLAAYGHD